MTSSMLILSDRVYSYKTMIALYLPGFSIGNVTRYSNATSRHQTVAHVLRCDILLDNVPQGCEDLLAVAILRGIVARGVKGDVKRIVHIKEMTK